MGWHTPRRLPAEAELMCSLTARFAHHLESRLLQAHLLHKTLSSGPSFTQEQLHLRDHKDCVISHTVRRWEASERFEGWAKLGSTTWGRMHSLLPNAHSGSASGGCKDVQDAKHEFQWQSIQKQKWSQNQECTPVSLLTIPWSCSKQRTPGCSSDHPPHLASSL